jgi:hypothetical protein
MTTTPINSGSITNQSSFVGNIRKEFEGILLNFTFIMDKNSPKGVFAFAKLNGDGTSERAYQDAIYEYTHNSTNFAIDAYSLYTVLEKWQATIRYRHLSGQSEATALNRIKNTYLKGTQWETISFTSEPVSPENHPMCQSEDFYSHRFNALGFHQFFAVPGEVLNTCIMWGSDIEGSVEVLNEIYFAGILATHMPQSSEVSSFRDSLEDSLRAFFKPVDLRLSDSEFRQVPRRVMGKKLLKELELSECPDCPICMDAIKSRQHCVVLGCNHLMHIGCARDWLTKHCTKPTCPLCRCCVRESIQEGTERTPDTRPSTPISAPPLSPPLTPDSMPDLIDDDESLGQADPYEYMDDLSLGQSLDNILDPTSPLPIENFILPPNVTVRRRLNFDDDNVLDYSMSYNDSVSEMFAILNSLTGPRVTNTASI